MTKLRLGLLGTLVVLAGCGSALGQGTDPSPWAPPVVPNGVMVPLIQQDQSDCENSTVADDPNRTRGGEIWVVRQDNGTTAVNVALTATPNTTYHIFLKCDRQLGDIVTGDEGVGITSFSFPTSELGSTYAFDVYPEGAPSGEKFQSMTVRLP